MKLSIHPLLPLLLLACYGPGVDPAEPAAPPELGEIDWLRDLDLAEGEAARRKAPILLVFQEVPG